MVKYNAVSGIYVIANIKNGKVYIGQAIDIVLRWKDHCYELKAQRHSNRHLQNAWNKYGEKSFKFQILERCPVEQLDEREQHYLDVYIPKGICYNIARDATAPMRGVKHSEETKAKLRVKNSGENNAFFGKTHTRETRVKISEKALGRKVSEGTRAKLSITGKGRRHTKEAKLKISISNKGHKHTPESIKKMRENHKSLPLTEAHKLKISQSLKGRTFSEEHRRKIGEANKRRSPEVRQKISESNARRVCTEETRRKMSESAKNRRKR